MTVTVAQVWAWVLVWSIAAFIPTPLGLWGDAIFYASICSFASLGCAITLTGLIRARGRSPRALPSGDTRSRIRRRGF